MADAWVNCMHMDEREVDYTDAYWDGTYKNNTSLDSGTEVELGNWGVTDFIPFGGITYFAGAALDSNKNASYDTDKKYIGSFKVGADCSASWVTANLPKEDARKVCYVRLTSITSRMNTLKVFGYI